MSRETMGADSMQDDSENPENKETLPKKMSVFGYVTSELTRGYFLERDKAKFSERRERVYTFMKTPRELEKFVVFGFFQCMDAFLFLFTFLPLRIVLASLKFLTHPCGSLFSPRSLEPAHICDILKGVIILGSYLVVDYIDTSMMYHLVRGQAVIKLYVFYNMLEIADRMFSSFGQDILDALFWTATEPKGRKREHIGVIPHLLLAIVYVVVHALLILFQATVLNVAFNSHNKALLTIMMSNNFIEIKGSLFKKIDRNFLYHIACSDVKERFHYLVLLGIVFIRNMNEFAWNFDHMWVIMPDAVLVFVAEIIVDWVKHAFILKFNEIPADVYHTFSVRLAKDVIENRQSRAFIDYSDLISRRMSFTPIPLLVLILRICTKSFRVSGYMGTLILVMLYLCLMSFKIFCSIITLGKAYQIIENASEEDQKEDMKKNSSKHSKHSHQSTDSSTANHPSSDSERRTSLPLSASVLKVNSYESLRPSPQRFSKSDMDLSNYQSDLFHNKVEDTVISEQISTAFPHGDNPEHPGCELRHRTIQVDQSEHRRIDSSGPGATKLDTPELKIKTTHIDSSEPSPVLVGAGEHVPVLVQKEQTPEKVRHMSTESTV